MSQPPSRSPDSLTGVSAEISALQLVERGGDEGIEEGRERWMKRRVGDFFLGGGGGEREGIESKKDKDETEEGNKRDMWKKNSMKEAGENYNSGRALFCLQHLCHSFLLILPSPAHMPFILLLCILHHPSSSCSSSTHPEFQINASPLFHPPNLKLLLRSTVIRHTNGH